MLLKNATYDRLKWATTIVLPASGALYAGLAILWGFPHGKEVSGTIALIATFCGALMGLSSVKFNAQTPDDVYEGRGDDWPDDKENTD